MTDQQVLDWLDGHAGPVCGRFQPDQLNRPLKEQSAKKPGPGRYWHYFIALFLSSSELAAQTRPAKPATTQPIPFGRDARMLTGDTAITGESASPPDVLHGTLVDGNGHPVSFATILYKEHKGVSADAGGRFSIPRAHLAGSRVLTISAVGYETLQVDVSQLQNGLINTPPMQELVGTLGGLVVVARHRKRRPIADTLAVIKDTLAACFNLPKKNFTVYPNPVPRGNSITITAQADKPGSYAVQLFNISGELLQSTTASRDQLTGAFPLTLPPTLSPGTYIIRLSHPEMAKVYTQPIIVL